MVKKRRQQSTMHNSQSVSTHRKIVKLIFVDPAEFDTRFDQTQEPVVCETVGWLTELTRKHVKLTWLLNREDQGDSTGLVIPRGCVAQIRTMRVGRHF